MRYDVVISGAGMVGATLACLLANAGKRVAVLDTQTPPAFIPGSAFDLRVSALSRYSRRVLDEAGAWLRVAAMRTTAYEEMVVWDAGGKGEIRFSAAQLGEPELGHIVENQIVQRALFETMQALPGITLYCPATIQSFKGENQAVHLVLDNDERLTADLLVGADGARSRVRELANIAWLREDYAQKGLVCVVRTALPHQYTAWQRFMPGGPLAFLPLSDPHYSSIVWTLPADRADVLVKQEEAVFKLALAEALEQRLGAIEWLGQRGAFPLAGAQAERYVQANVALIGDAAHTIHPLAGQGVNLGIKDAAELAQQIERGSDQGHCGELKTLRRYERARKGDNQLTLKAMEGFRLLFGNTNPPLQISRNAGLSLVNSVPWLKKTLARQAMGI